MILWRSEIPAEIPRSRLAHDAGVTEGSLSEKAQGGGRPARGGAVSLTGCLLVTCVRCSCQSGADCGQRHRGGSGRRGPSLDSEECFRIAPTPAHNFLH